MREVEALNFSWFLKLRWGAIGAELLVFLAGDRLMHVALPLAPMLLVVGVAVSTNLACALWARRRTSVPGSALAALMVLDSLLLTAMLYFIGGDSNPFAVLYLVNIALAAVLLPPKWTWGITALSLTCGGLLFLGRSTGMAAARALAFVRGCRGAARLFHPAYGPDVARTRADRGVGSSGGGATWKTGVFGDAGGRCRP
jgi:two-component system sensor histidine kinase RegB